MNDEFLNCLLAGLFLGSLVFVAGIKSKERDTEMKQLIERCIEVKKND